MDEKEVVKLMESSETAQQWNENIDKVKRSFGGQYPPFWYSAIIESKVADNTAKKWGRSDKLHFECIR